MFAGSDDGGRRAAILYAVISTAVLFGVEPWAYVRDLLEKISAGFAQRRIAELLPDAWGPLHTEARLPGHGSHRPYTGRLSAPALAAPCHSAARHGDLIMHRRRLEPAIRRTVTAGHGSDRSPHHRDHRGASP